MKKIALALGLAEKATELQIIEAIEKLKGKEIQQKPERELKAMGKEALVKHAGLAEVFVSGDGTVFGTQEDPLQHARPRKLNVVVVKRKEDNVEPANEQE